jgi:hypothetical protein
MQLSDRPLDNLLKLNLGCGSDLRKDMVNLDLRPLPGVDIVHDINLDWPFLPDRFEEILASHILEHARSLIFQMNQAWKVLSSGGRIFVTVPWFAGQWAHGDPEHIRFFDHRSFDPFSDTHHIFKTQGIKGPWKKVDQDYILEPADADFKFLAFMGLSRVLGIKVTLQKP